jgi:hypothetical protein
MVPLRRHAQHTIAQPTKPPGIPFSSENP